MKKENATNFVFKNKVLSFESRIYEFKSEIYDDFDKESKKIGLQSKIDDLFNGEKVNNSEELAAWHPK